MGDTGQGVASTTTSRPRRPSASQLVQRTRTYSRGSVSSSSHRRGASSSKPTASTGSASRTSKATSKRHDIQTIPVPAVDEDDTRRPREHHPARHHVRSPSAPVVPSRQSLRRRRHRRSASRSLSSSRSKRVRQASAAPKAVQAAVKALVPTRAASCDILPAAAWMALGTVHTVVLTSDHAVRDRVRRMLRPLPSRDAVVRIQIPCGSCYLAMLAGHVTLLLNTPHARSAPPLWLQSLLVATSPSYLVVVAAITSTDAEDDAADDTAAAAAAGRTVNIVSSLGPRVRVASDLLAAAVSSQAAPRIPGLVVTPCDQGVADILLPWIDAAPAEPAVSSPACLPACLVMTIRDARACLAAHAIGVVLAEMLQSVPVAIDKMDLAGGWPYRPRQTLPPSPGPVIGLPVVRTTLSRELGRPSAARALPVALVGRSLGSKSALAAWYACEVQASGELVFWINAATVLESVRRIADLLGLLREDIKSDNSLVSLVMTTLDNMRDHRWLLVIDGIPNHASFTAAVLPPCTLLHRILLVGASVPASWPVRVSVALPPALPLADVAVALRTAADPAALATLRLDHVARMLAQHPLALRLCLGLLRHQPAMRVFDLLDALPHAQPPLAAVLRAAMTASSPLARDVLAFASFMASCSVPISLLLLPAMPPGSSLRRVHAAVAELVAIGVAVYDGFDSVSVHPCVAALVRQSFLSISAAATTASAVSPDTASCLVVLSAPHVADAEATVAMLLRACQGFNFEDPTTFFIGDRLVQHVAAFLDRGIASGMEQATLQTVHAHILHLVHRRPASAVPLLRDSLAMTTQLLGRETLAAADVMNSLSWSLRNLEGPASRTGSSELAEGMALLQEALRIRRAVVGPVNHLVAQIMNNIAMSLARDYDRWGEAAEMFEASAEMTRTTIGTSHPDYFVVIRNLSIHLDRMGRSDEAARRMHTLIAIVQATLGERDDRLARAMMNTGEMLIGLKRYPDALRLIRRSLELRLQYADENPGAYLMSMRALAYVLQRSDRISEATPMARAVLDMHRYVHGRDALPTIYAVSTLTTSLSKQRKQRKAKSPPSAEDEDDLGHEVIQLLRQALNSAEREHQGSILHICVLEELADEYEQRQDYPKALSMYHRAAELRKVLDGAESRGYARALNHLGLCYSSASNPTAALPFYQQVVELELRLHGVATKLVADALNNLASCQEDLHMVNEAIETYKRAVAATKIAWGTEHEYVVSTLLSLAQSLQTARRDSEAVVYVDEAVALATRVFGSLHPSYLEAITALGYQHRLLGNYDKALDTLQEALQLSRHLHPSGHSKTIWLMHEVAMAMTSLARHDDAIVMYQDVLDLLQDSDSSNTELLEAKLSLAECLRAVHEYERSIELSEQVVERQVALHPDTFNQPYSLQQARHNSALCYVGLGRDHEALPRLARLYDIVSMIYDNNTDFVRTVLADFLACSERVQKQHVICQR